LKNYYYYYLYWQLNNKYNYFTLGALVCKRNKRRRKEREVLTNLLFMSQVD